MSWPQDMPPSPPPTSTPPVPNHMHTTSPVRQTLTSATRALSSLSLSLKLPPHGQHDPPTPPTSSTPLPSGSGGPNANAGAGVMTPAPSPRLGRRPGGREDEDEVEEAGWGSETLNMRDRAGKGKEVEGVADFQSQGDQAPTALLNAFTSLPPSQRFAFLSLLVGELRMPEALVVSRNIEPRLKRDFLRELPIELALHCLSFVDDARTLSRASQVSKHWSNLLQDEQTWKDMMHRHSFTAPIRSPFLPHSTMSRSRPLGTNYRMYAPPSLGQMQLQMQQQGMINWSMALQMAQSGQIGAGMGMNMGGIPGPTEPMGSARRRSSPKKRSRRDRDKDAASGSSSFSMREGGSKPETDQATSFKEQFRHAYLTESNWLNAGRMLASHTSQDDGVVTTLSVTSRYIVIGMANAKIHIFDANTGAFRRSLIGHELGVWALVVIIPQPPAAASEAAPASTSSSSKHRFHGLSFDEIEPSRLPRAPTQYRDDGQSRRASFNGGMGPADMSAPTGSNTYAYGYGISRPNTALGFGARLGDSGRRIPADSGFGLGTRMRSSDVCGSARGWGGGETRNLVVSGGCDKELKVWDGDTGRCIYSLRGHTSTIRCVKVLDQRPIAISGSRDCTLRVWDIERGVCLHVLAGHSASVRCIEIAGNVVVSGSYDYVCRVWDVDSGRCIHALVGHYQEIYAVAFDGERIVTGSLDSTIRVWSAKTGECLAVLQGHTSLIGQVQLTGDRLVTGGSDGRVIIFNLATLSCVHRLCAHDNSVTCLQFDDRFIVSGGNDGRVKLWDVRTGMFIRELTQPCDAVWRVSFKDDRCAVLCQRGGSTKLEVISFRAGEEGGWPMVAA
ncbi:WD40-repeat-containing domain protein [Naematelia encephala]|uniref:WD40-repeat-containing domain protein n=1 Tax=Naematelia encephala TaxID=71784 RepID=A0A1Y2B7T3_9TREE|nr:WD40-repeat-containing domain protein [Naematelia encephala]